MNDSALLRIEGLVECPAELSFDDLANLDDIHQVADIQRFDPKRRGDAVTLSGVLSLVGVKPDADYIGLHGSLDDFHASVPLAPIRDRALLIYRLDGRPLETKAGGPIRLLIPDYAACHTHEVDECANVKFLDRIELTAGKGFDNRPHDEAEHADLHRREQEGSDPGGRD